MPRSIARSLGELLLGATLVLFLGAALVLSLASSAFAQTPSKSLATVEEQRANTPPPPLTAPTGKVPVNPERGMKPGQAQSTATGPTSVPGWNQPPAAWNPPSELPQYASLPGRETNILIQ